MIAALYIVVETVEFFQKAGYITDINTSFKEKKYFCPSLLLFNPGL